VERRLRPACEAAGLPYPPGELALLAFKDSKMLETYARPPGEGWRFVRAYPVLAASGEPGPKLREGDRQVPEGVYRVELLNPNSRFHVSLRLDYPNDFDRRMARADGRTELGGDIMIHGNAVSIGCLAMGDEAAEDLFVLAALVGKERVTVMICPTDLRLSPPVISNEKPGWVKTLYATLAQELHAFKW
jgi:murein L,D-transpeptidase YafK